jgi:hypothetical protein
VEGSRGRERGRERGNRRQAIMALRRFRRNLSRDRRFALGVYHIGGAKAECNSAIPERDGSGCNAGGIFSG